MNFILKSFLYESYNIDSNLAFKVMLSCTLFYSLEVDRWQEMKKMWTKLK